MVNFVVQPHFTDPPSIPKITPNWTKHSLKQYFKTPAFKEMDGRNIVVLGIDKGTYYTQEVLYIGECFSKVPLKLQKLILDDLKEGYKALIVDMPLTSLDAIVISLLENPVKEDKLYITSKEFYAKYSNNPT